MRLRDLLTSLVGLLALAFLASFLVWLGSGAGPQPEGGMNSLLAPQEAYACIQEPTKTRTPTPKTAFSTPTIVASGLNGPRSVYAADMDQTQGKDILFVEKAGNRVQWLVNNGQGQFSNPTPIATPTPVQGPNAILAAWLNGDDKLDIAVGAEVSHNLEWFRNNLGNTPPWVQNTAESGASAKPLSIDAADLNEDGTVDLLSADYGTNQVVWYSNSLAGTFTRYTIYSLANCGPRGIQAADVDGDGDLDVVVGLEGISAIHWHANQNGVISSTPNIIESNLSRIWDIHAVDIDNDADIDILAGRLGEIATAGDGAVYLYSNNGSGVFTRTTVLSGIDPIDVYAADYDNDGDQDILCASYNQNGSVPDLLWIENLSGGSSWNKRSLTIADNLASSIHSGDFDRDGDQDIVAALEGDNRIVVLSNSLATRTPTRVPTPVAVWQAPLTPVFAGTWRRNPADDLDTHPSGQSYGVYFGGNVPNKPSSYSIGVSVNGGSPTPIAPSLTYDSSSQSFQFSDQSSTAGQQRNYYVSVKNAQGTPLPFGSSRNDSGKEPPQWKGGLRVGSQSDNNINIPLQITSVDSITSITTGIVTWPVTTAIPFPPGKLYRRMVSSLRIMPPGTNVDPSPAQFTVKELWKYGGTTQNPDPLQDEVRWLQVDFLVSREAILNQSVYTLIFDHANQPKAVPQPQQPLRVYQYLRPTFQLDFDLTDPSVARIAAPDTEIPLITTFSDPPSFTKGYECTTLSQGRSFDSSTQRRGLTYARAGNLDMSHGTVELWYCPDWDRTSIPYNKNPNLFSAGQDAPPLRLWLSLDDPSTAILNFTYRGFPATLLETSVTLNSSNWNNKGWNRIAASWDVDQGIRLFLNDVLVDADRRTFTKENASNITIGYCPSGELVYYRGADGKIDDVRIFEDFAEEVSFFHQSLVLNFDEYKSSASLIDPQVQFNRSAVTVPSSFTSQSRGVQGKGISTSGADEEIDVDAKGIVPSSAGCIDFWFSIDQNASGEQGLFHARSGIGKGIMCWYNATTHVLSSRLEGSSYLQIDKNDLFLKNEPSQFKWHHLAVVYQKSGFFPFDPLNEIKTSRDTDGFLAMYLDGESLGTINDNWSGFSLDPLIQLQIGIAQVGTSVCPLNGSIDEFRVWTQPRRPWEKVSAFCSDAYYQIRMDKMNFIDFCQVRGKVSVDSRDLSGTRPPGFVVGDQLVTDPDNPDPNVCRDLFSAEASYYQPVSLTVFDTANDMTTSKTVDVYSPFNTEERAKINDFRILRGPVRTTLEVRSLCQNRPVPTETPQRSCYAISRYHLHPGIPAIRNFFTFVLTDPTNPDPLWTNDGSTQANSSTARMYRDLAIELDMNNINAMDYGYLNPSQTPIATRIPVTTGTEWVYQFDYDSQGSMPATDQYSQVVGVIQPDLTSTPPPTNQVYNPPITPAPNSETPYGRYKPRVMDSDLPLGLDNGTRNNHEMEGWIVYSTIDGYGGMALFIKDLPAMYPKKFSVVDSGAKDKGIFHIWGYQQIDTDNPDPGISYVRIDWGSMRNLYFVHQGQYNPSGTTQKYFLDFNVPTYVSNIDSGDHENWPHLLARSADALGLARTHEMIILPFHKQGNTDYPAIRSYNTLLQSRVFAIPDSTSLCQAMGEDELAPFSGDYSGQNSVLQFASRIDTAQRESFDSLLGQDSWFRPTGMFNWGDNPSRWYIWLNIMNGAYRTWAGNHHGIPRALWLMFFRTGDPQYLEIAERNSLKLTDTFWIHWNGYGYNLFDKAQGALNKYNGLVPWSSGLIKSDGSGLDLINGSRRVQQVHHNAETDYLQYYSYFSGNDWGTETANDFLRYTRHMYSYWSRPNSDSSDHRTVRKRSTDGRAGAGQLSALLESYYSSMESLAEPERTPALAFVDEQMNVFPTPTDPTDLGNEDKYLAFKRLRISTDGGRYNTGGDEGTAEGYRKWTPWLQRLLLYYSVRNDTIKRDEFLRILKKWSDFHAERRSDSGPRQLQFNFTALDWDAAAINWMDEIKALPTYTPLPGPTPTRQITPVPTLRFRDYARTGWEHVARQFDWIVYRQEWESTPTPSPTGTLVNPTYAPFRYTTYDNLHINDTIQARDSGTYYYTFQHLAYWLSAIIRDQDRGAQSAIPTNGPGGASPRFGIGMAWRNPTVAAQTPTPTYPIFPNQTPHPGTEMRITFQQGSTLRPRAGGGALRAFFNFDDESFVSNPSNQIGSTLFAWRNDFGSVASRGISDSTDVYFNRSLMVSNPNNSVQMDTDQLFEPGTSIAISFWAKRDWDFGPTETPTPFPIFDYREPDSGYAMRIEISKNGSNYDITLRRRGISSNDYVKIQNYPWAVGEWKKIVAALSCQTGTNYRLNIFDRSTPTDSKMVKASQSQTWVSWTSTPQPSYDADRYYKKGIIRLGGAPPPPPVQNENDRSTWASWSCLIDNFTVNDQADSASLSSNLDTLSYFVYRDGSGTIKLIDGDYDGHTSLVKAYDFNALDIYPGFAEVNYYVSCPISDDVNEKVSVGNRSSWDERAVVAQMAPIVFHRSDYSSGAQVVVDVRKGLYGARPFQFSVAAPDGTILDKRGDHSLAIPIYWAGPGRETAIVRPVGPIEAKLMVNYSPPQATPTRITFSIERPTPVP